MGKLKEKPRKDSYGKSPRVVPTVGRRKESEKGRTLPRSQPKDAGENSLISGPSIPRLQGAPSDYALKAKPCDSDTYERPSETTPLTSSPALQPDET